MAPHNMRRERDETPSFKHSDHFSLLVYTRARAQNLHIPSTMKILSLYLYAPLPVPRRTPPPTPSRDLPISHTSIASSSSLLPLPTSYARPPPLLKPLASPQRPTFLKPHQTSCSLRSAGASFLTHGVGEGEGGVSRCIRPIRSQMDQLFLLEVKLRLIHMHRQVHAKWRTIRRL